VPETEGVASCRRCREPVRTSRGRGRIPRNHQHRQRCRTRSRECRHRRSLRLPACGETPRPARLAG
jgi:hypothetical protein